MKKAIAIDPLKEFLKSKTENEVNKEVNDLLNLYGIYHWRNNSGGSTIAKKVNSKTGSGKVWKHYYVDFGKEGSSDFIGICPDGRFLAIECKRPSGGVVSDLQKKFLDEIIKRGGVGIITRGAEDCLAQMKEWGVIQ